jgi:ParB-like chromosome segregation protein Spo0J
VNVPKPNGKVHPVTALFPLMSDEELDELAADIKANGLNQPIVLDAEGTLIDGRNRLEACRRAGVEPSYTGLNGQNPVAFIFSQNIARRHLNQGQRAVLVVKIACSPSEQTYRDLAKVSQISSGYIGEASTILKHAPDLAEAIVFNNANFEVAYQEAKRRKEIKAHNEANEKRQVKEPLQDATDAIIAEQEKIRTQEEQRKAAVQQQLREIKAQNLFTILGCLALGKQSSAERAADLLDYDEETLKNMQLSPSKQLWEKAIETLKECAKQWEGK